MGNRGQKSEAGLWPRQSFSRQELAAPPETGSTLDRDGLASLRHGYYSSSSLGTDIGHQPDASRYQDDCHLASTAARLPSTCYSNDLVRTRPVRGK
jgi:hypothetical protein